MWRRHIGISWFVNVGSSIVTPTKHLPQTTRVPCKTARHTASSGEQICHCSTERFIALCLPLVRLKDITLHMLPITLGIFAHLTLNMHVVLPLDFHRGKLTVSLKSIVRQKGNGVHQVETSQNCVYCCLLKK